MTRGQGASPPTPQSIARRGRLKLSGNSSHFKLKHGGVGRARKHAAYAIGAGKYSSREDVLFFGTGNMPAWATDDPLIFWQAADTHEGEDGRTYYEQEIALPRELTEEQLRELVETWIDHDIGARHPYLYSIHMKLADDGLPNPHLHLIISDRTMDGIERPPELFFKRPSTRYRDRKGQLHEANPTKGGAAKDRRWAGNKKIVEELRSKWQEFANRFLVEHGHEPRLDLRSNAERGLGEPEPKIGPEKRKGDRWRSQRVDEVKAIRQRRRRVRVLGDEIATTKQEIRTCRRERARQDANTCQDASRRNQRPHRSPLGAMRAEVRRGRTVYRWGRGAAAGLAALVDRGDLITLAGKPSTHKARALVELAKAKGWPSLVLTGSPEFKRLAVREALREGLRVANPELSVLVKEEEIQMQQHASRADLARQWLMTASRIDALEAAKLKEDPERLQRLFENAPEARQWALIQRQKADGVPEALLGFQIDREAQGVTQGTVRHVGKKIWIEPHDRPGHVVPVTPTMPVRPGQRVAVHPDGQIEILQDWENTPHPR